MTPPASNPDRDFGRLEGKVDALLYEVRTANAGHTKTVAELGKRVSKLEGWRLWIIAYSAGVGGTLTVLSLVLWRVLSVL